MRLVHKLIDRVTMLVRVGIQRFTEPKETKRVEPLQRIQGVRNSITYEGSDLDEVRFEIYGDDNQIRIGEGCRLRGVVFRIRGSGHVIELEKGVRFNRGGSIWFEDEKGALHIGSNTTFEDVHIAVTEPGSKVSIGHDCMFADDIDVRTGDSHSVIAIESGVRINFAENIEIGDHVWVASRCILLKGVELQKNSIVASGSVVTRKFEEQNIIVAGNPAKKIKSDVTWTRQRHYHNPVEIEQAVSVEMHRTEGIDE